MNINNIDPKFQKQLLQNEKKLPVWQQLQTLQDIAAISGEMLKSIKNISTYQENNTSETDNQKQLGALAVDIRNQLIDLNNKEVAENPDFGQFSKPIVTTLDKLIKIVNNPPPINVASPTVNVDVNTTDIAKILNKDLPKAFNDAIKLIPQPKDFTFPTIPDNTDNFKEVIDWLKSIDTAVRKHPMLGSSTAAGGGSATASNQTSGLQKTQITDSSGTANTLKTLNTQVVATDVGLVTNAVMHGITTGGGGGYVDVKVNPSGALTVEATLAASTVSIGNVNLSPLTGGWTSYFANAITTTVTVSATTGKFGGYMLINLNSSPIYLQFFDTTGAVTLGTTVPTFVVTIPANGTAANGFAANLELANGASITNGIKVAATTTSNGATTVSTGITGTIWYH